MVCLCPTYLYQRASYPIHCTDDELKKLNKLQTNFQNGWIEIQVPCRHCLGCRLDHANEWATRCYCEMKTVNKGCFLTLTYNNQNLPLGGYLIKRDIQLFLKKLRKKYPDNDIRYLVCGEYGPHGGRPHYHMICYGWQPDNLKVYRTNKKGDVLYQSEELYHGGNQGLWGKGFCTIGELNYQTACYTARYVQKKAGIDVQHREYIDYKDPETGMMKSKIKKTDANGKPPEFILSSKQPAIGRRYWEQHKEKIKKDNGILIFNGKRAVLKPIPSYFKRLWKEENPEEFYNNRYTEQLRTEEGERKLLQAIKLKDQTIFADADVKLWYQKQYQLETQKILLNQRAKALRRDNIA